MQAVNIFLGSSFKLMAIRNLIGDTIRQLNDHWINEGIQIKLHIWEDFVIGYSGKHKQQEYIDEMVLPSDICIFIFSHRVGMFTKMELEAKIEQDKSAVFCYRMPYKRKWIQNVLNELNNIGAQPKDIADDHEICKEVKTIIENYIHTKIVPDKNKNPIKETYFYTTIPDDLPRIQENIGNTIRNFDNATMDDWGIHCVLHPRKQQELLDQTDHYIPILKHEVSEDDIQELSSGIKKSSDSSHRMRRMTVFDMDNIYKSNERVHNLLDKAGIFTDKINDLNALKWKLHEWLRIERKKLFSTSTCSFETQYGVLKINNNPIASLSAIDQSGKMEKEASEIDKLNISITNAIASNEADQTILSTIEERNSMRKNLSITISQKMNSWTNNIIESSDEFIDMIEKCARLENRTITLLDLLKNPANENIKQELKDIILQREDLEYQLASKNATSPLRLLSYQLYMVAIFDTYLNEIVQLKEEDELYARIISYAEKFSIEDPNVEMMRMNIANMYSQLGDYLNARDAYRTAIANLQKMYDGSVFIARNITYILTHLFHLELDLGNYKNATETLMMFKEHIARLDMIKDSFLVDQCMYITAELTIIDNEDDSAFETVMHAEELLKAANDKQLLQPTDDAFVDVFVYLPNMIAGYYIDHKLRKSNPNSQSYFIKAEDFINLSWNNNLKLTEQEYLKGLFQQAEIKHQMGFLYIKFPPTWEKALDSYESALNLKQRYYELTKHITEEIRIAQTLVNYGAAELTILQNYTQFKATKEYKLSPLDKANKALNIYKKHIHPDNNNSELWYYEALQLKATILEYMYQQNPNNISADHEAMNAYYRCWNWNKGNPHNKYRMCFINISGKALLRRGFISKDEFYTIKDLCTNI